jgi:hypothetical protein
MMTWEYKVFVGDLYQHELNKFGAEGWELISVVTTPLHDYRCVFKRRTDEYQSAMCQIEGRQTVRADTWRQSLLAGLA